MAKKKPSKIAAMTTWIKAHPSANQPQLAAAMKKLGYKHTSSSELSTARKRAGIVVGTGSKPRAGAPVAKSTPSVLTATQQFMRVMKLCDDIGIEAVSKYVALIKQLG